MIPDSDALLKRAWSSNPVTPMASATAGAVGVYTAVQPSDYRCPSLDRKVASVATFWRLAHPEYRSDYKHSYINGSLEHPFALPGVCCDVCGATWGGSRILAQECPPKFPQHKNLRDRWPISRTDHAKLQRELMTALGTKGVPFVDLRPGDDFQPCFLDVPSRPRADFLWSGLGSFVVTDRVRDLLLRMAVNDIPVCPVTLRKIGKRKAKLPPPMPSTGEPEDIINEVPLLDDPSTVGSYSEVVVLHESGFPPGGTPISVCSGCRRPEIGRNREFRMTAEMWNGQSIFFMATTLYVIVTDGLKQAIESLRPTNIIFKPV